MKQDEVLQAVRDPQRLQLLNSLNLLDTPAEEAFDRLTRLASKITDSPISLVSLVDADRQFFKSLFGLPKEGGRSTPLSHSFCKHVVADNKPLVVEDARAHPFLKYNLAVPDMSVIGYLGMPLTTTEGVTLGSFCVIDTKPRLWTEREIDIIRELAQSTMTEIELRAQIAAREEAEKRIENLTDMIVHDLRTPLTIIGGSLEILQDSCRKPSLAERNVEIIRDGLSAVTHMNNMIEDMLTLSRSGAGMLEPYLLETRLNDFLEDLEKLYQTRAEIEEKRFVLRLAADLPPVWIDQALIRRVLDNLVDNAFKYSPPEGEIKLTACYDPQREIVVVGVYDEGPGIAPAAQEAIFDKFFQASDAHAGRPVRRGSGIGLSFCKLAVELHGGRIWVESRPGQGSAFYFSLPQNS